MDVLYTCDNNYIWLTGISAISMFENNRDLDNLHVWLLGEKISDENKQILKEIGEKYGREITVIDVPEIDIPDALVSARWPLSAFTRLYAGELLPDDLDKVLYLDGDTIIKGSLKELENWNVTSKTFWGIKDCIGKEYKKNIGIEPNGIYVNAGVLLINLKELRRVSIKEKLSSYMVKYKKLINYADQDVLNGVFNGSIGVLPPQHDVMSIVVTYTYEEITKLRRPTNYYRKEEIEKAIEKPIIIHYTTNMRTIRPWFLDSNHPKKTEFFKYMSISPWKNLKLRKMVFTTKESKIIFYIQKLPKKLSLAILGVLHTEIKPRFIRRKAKKHLYV